MNKECNIVADLLPLYHDGVCSDESKQMVEKHIAQCDHCRKMYKRMDGELVSPNAKDADIQPLKSITRTVKKGKRNALIIGIFIPLAVLLIVFAGWYIRWYTQEYTYYTQFAEDMTPLSVHEYGEDGTILQSIVLDSSNRTHFDSTYRYEVKIPGFLSDRGDISMTRLDNSETQHIHVGISQWYDTAYVFHVSILRQDTGDDHYFIVDSHLNLYYLDHWSDNYKQQVQADLEAHKTEIQKLINDAKAMWPFIE